MFGSTEEFYQVSESKLPCIKFTEDSRSIYCGREYLQRFYNTIKDPRGRWSCGSGSGGISKEKSGGGQTKNGQAALKKIDSSGRAPNQQKSKKKGRASAGGGSVSNVDRFSNVGVWFYFFPRLSEEDLPIQDFQDSAGNQDHAKVARWHHGRGFIKLSKLRLVESSKSNINNNNGNTNQHQLEGRVFLSQVKQMPEDCNAAGDLPKGPFEEKRTYIKFTLKFDRLETLCPRNIPELDVDRLLFGKDPFPPAVIKSPMVYFLNYKTSIIILIYVLKILKIVKYRLITMRLTH